MPPAYRGNIDKQLPLDGRAAGSQPPMTERQVADLICFLRTLTDDFHPGAPSAAPAPGCLDCRLSPAGGPAGKASATKARAVKKRGLHGKWWG